MRACRLGVCAPLLLAVLLCGAPCRAADVTAGWSRGRGLRLRWAEADLEARLRGVLAIDGAAVAGGPARLEDEVEVRRARLGLGVSVHRYWRAKLLVAIEEGKADFKDAWLAYRGLDRFVIQLGQFQEPFSMEELSSSRQLTFLERALPNELVPSYHLGLGVRTHGRRWGAAAGLFEGTIEDESLRERDTGWGTSARFTTAPLHRSARIVHLGIAGTYREPDADREVRFRARPEAHLVDEPLLDSGRIGNVEHQLGAGLEGAVQIGPWLVQGEYIRADVDRRGGRAGAHVDGWYVAGSWLIGAAPRRYDVARGTFGGVRPLGPFGAWELAARASGLDLTDTPRHGNRAVDVTVGVNWYPIRGVRMMLNWVHVALEGAGGDADFDPLQGRAQVEF